MHRLFPPFVRGFGAIGLLAVRLVMGLAFIMHGWAKVQSPNGWMGWMGDALPGPLQGLAVAGQVGGGVLLVLGLLTPLACMTLGITMIVAIATVHGPKGHPFVGAPGEDSYELAAIYLATAISILFVGPGALSADACLFDKPPAL